MKLDEFLKRKKSIEVSALGREIAQGEAFPKCEGGYIHPDETDIPWPSAAWLDQLQKHFDTCYGGEQ